MELKLYNTLTRRKEPFQPLRPGLAGIYTCGPTVYADAHIGNLRSYVFPDVLKKLLRRLGYRVTHVINITDVGHLTSNEDQGEDKMERAARAAGRSAWEIAAEHAGRFFEDLERLNIERPDVTPRAAGPIPEALAAKVEALSPLYARLPGHIAEQIALIRRLEVKGVIYRTEDGIYFDTSRFPEYGRLARIQVQGLQEGARVEMGGKRHKTDFALWKFSPPDAKRQMEWDSPWGRGFPGWHIECSAMAMKYLGESFDIHTGGTDHIPVHHTNEIAQSETATGKPFVSYWLHGEFLVLGEEQRMGKSEGNLIALEELIGRGFEPMVYRYLVLNTHYRKFLNFSWEAMQAAREGLRSIRSSLKQAEIGRPVPPWTDLRIPEKGPAHDLIETLCDDLNTPKALAILQTALRDKSSGVGDKQELAMLADDILSIDIFNYRASELGGNIIDATGTSLRMPADTPENVYQLANRRIQARRQNRPKDMENLRSEIRALGWDMRDSRHGYELLPLDIANLAQQRWEARIRGEFAESDRLRDELVARGWIVRDRKDDYELFVASHAH